MMLRIVIILLFVLLGLCKDVIANSKSCRVLDIPNGDFGRYVSRFDFEKVDRDEVIRDKEILTLRCHKGYAPFPRQNNNSKNGFFEEITTCEDGIWSKFLLCHSSRCGNPPSIKNGYTIVGNRTHPGKDHGDVVTYVCRDRNVVEKGKVVCHFGEWVGEPPTCMDNSCSIPDVENGEIGQFKTSDTNRNYEEFKKFTEGQRVNEDETLYLRCQNGFFPGDNSVVYFSNRFEIRCNGGMWSKLLQCKAAPCLGEPPKIDNGYPVIHNREHGYIVSYICNNNDIPVKSNVTCHFGSWIGNAPKCLESFCYVPDVEHGEMGQFESQIISRWSTILEFKKFSTGQQVKNNETLLLRCDEDFIPTDDSTIFENNELEVTCNDGTWSINLSCKQMSCFEDPPAIPNGKPLISSRNHGNVVWYTCDSKKYTKVPGAVSCHFGEWIGYPPKCLDSPCSTEELNFPGLLKPTEEQLSSMESFNIVCENGFSKSSFAKKVTCIEGKWDITQNPCTENHCNTNELNYPGLEKPAGVFLGSFADFTITCKDGFRKSSAKKTITCVKGKWDILEDPCSEEITCPMFSTDNGLSVSYSNDNNLGSLATFSCPDNTKFIGATRSFCQDDGIWSSPQPYCEDYVPCSRLLSSTGLVISYSKDISVGSKASFSCLFPYALVGSSYAICQNDGKWSHHLPQCEDLHPELLCSIDDLLMSVPEGVVPDMTGVTVKFMPLEAEIRLECENNLIPNGNSKALCRAGIWELGIFQCVPGCKLKVDPSSHLIIKPLKDSYRLGEFVLLSCPPGEKMTFNVARLMCLGKIWSDIVPDCKKFK